MSIGREAFYPGYTQGITITAGAASANGAVDSNTKRRSVCVTNLGAAVAYVRCGGSTVVATTADFPVLAGTQVTIGKEADFTHIAVIAPSGTPDVHAIPGSGHL